MIKMRSKCDIGKSLVKHQYMTKNQSEAKFAKVKIELTEAVTRDIIGGWVRNGKGTKRIFCTYCHQNNKYNRNEA